MSGAPTGEEKSKPPEPVQATGRPPLKVTLSVSLLFIFLGLITLILALGTVGFQFPVLLAVLLVAGAVMAVGVFGLISIPRLTSFAVDSHGVTIKGRLWGNFEASWSELGWVERAMVPALHERGTLAMAFAFVTHSGRFLGSTTPRSELDSANAEALEQGLIAHAQWQHTPIYSVPETRTSRWWRWGKLRRPQGRSRL